MQIPHKYIPYPHQRKLFNALHDGYKRVLAVWHRRAGKDKTVINLLAAKAMQEVGIYYYIFPTFVQGKRIVWDNREMMQHFPKEMVKSKNSVEMKIELVNVSIIQIVGSDRYDSLRGTARRS